MNVSYKLQCCWSWFFFKVVFSQVFATLHVEFQLRVKCIIFDSITTFTCHFDAFNYVHFNSSPKCNCLEWSIMPEQELNCKSKSWNYLFKMCANINKIIVLKVFRGQNDLGFKVQLNYVANDKSIWNLKWTWVFTSWVFSIVVAIIHANLQHSKVNIFSSLIVVLVFMPLKCIHFTLALKVIK